MGRAFEYRKATKLKKDGATWPSILTKLGKQIAIAVKAGGPEPENNPSLRAIIANCKRENMPKDNIARAIKNACGKDTSDYKEVHTRDMALTGVAVFVDTRQTTRHVLLLTFVLSSTSSAETWVQQVLCLSSSTTRLCSHSRRRKVWIWTR